MTSEECESMYIEVKPGVAWHPVTWITPAMWKIPFVVKCTGPSEYVPTITSAFDGIHCNNSYHYRGYALDWRIKDFPDRVETWTGRIKEKLGLRYYVELELIKRHIHIHWLG